MFDICTQGVLPFFINVKEPLIDAARVEKYGSFTKRVMMINLEVGGLLVVAR